MYKINWNLSKHKYQNDKLVFPNAKVRYINLFSTNIFIYLTKEDKVPNEKCCAPVQDVCQNNLQSKFGRIMILKNMFSDQRIEKLQTWQVSDDSFQ